MTTTLSRLSMDAARLFAPDRAPYRNPTDIRLYTVLRAMLSRRGYGLRVHSEYRRSLSSPEDCLYAVRIRKTKSGRRLPQFIDLQLALSDLITMEARTNNVPGVLRTSIDWRCAKGERHIRCLCGKPLLLEHRREGSEIISSIYRDVATGPDGPPRSHCPGCGVALTAATVRDISDEDLFAAITHETESRKDDSH